MAMQVAERLYTQGFIRFHSLSDIYKFQENSLSSTVMKPELEVKSKLNYMNRSQEK